MKKSLPFKSWLNWGLQLCEPEHRSGLSWLALLVCMTLGRTVYQIPLNLRQHSGPRMLTTQTPSDSGAAIFGSV